MAIIGFREWLPKKLMKTNGIFYYFKWPLFFVWLANVPRRESSKKFSREVFERHLLREAFLYFRR